MMPGIDGYEVCGKLKHDEITKDIPKLKIEEPLIHIEPVLIHPSRPVIPSGFDTAHQLAKQSDALA